MSEFTGNFANRAV